MKFKKPRGILLGIGIGAIVIAAALFFLVPVICGESFSYNGLDAFVKGVLALGSFNFVDVLYLALVVCFVIVLAVEIMYAVTAGQKKHKSHIFLAILSIILIFASYVVVSIYFLARDIQFNGAANGKLLEAMLKVDGQILGKILSSLVLAFAIISNVVLVVHSFVCMVSMIVTDEVNEFEEKMEEEKNQKLAEIAAEHPVVAEAAPAPVAVMPVDPVESAHAEIRKMIDESTLEERKEKEMKLFKECVDSGYFSEYEEIEFPEPIEGVDEEPVCEASIVEEKSAFVRKNSVHVGFTHE